MKIDELRKKSIQELETELTELHKEQFNLRMQSGMGQVPKPHLYKRVRRDIARVKTILTKEGDRAHE